MATISASTTHKKMKIKALFAFTNFIYINVAAGLTDYFFNKENLTAMGLLIGLYLFAFAVGDLFGESNSFSKKDVVSGLVLSIFLGVLGSVIVYHSSKIPPIAVYVSFAVVSIAPHQIIAFIRNNVTGILDKIKNKIFK